MLAVFTVLEGYAGCCLGCVCMCVCKGGDISTVLLTMNPMNYSEYECFGIAKGSLVGPEACGIGGNLCLVL